ncbi:histone H1 [Tabrizicola sp. DMG-N-6]|uniref:Histone H1 n=2 Tax=Szabonella alba TaxID=2804194 RepID=A0A8K0XZU6_9RHOB|nr:histone H1 [Szabonella alba]
MADKPKRPRDANQLAKFIVDLATDGESSVPLPDHEAQRDGGLKGGKARADKLSPDERAAIAQKAAKTRWGN